MANKALDLLKNHDFFFEFSEDMRVVREGYEQRMQIFMELQKLPMGEAIKVIDTHVPLDARMDFLINFSLKIRNDSGLKD